MKKDLFIKIMLSAVSILLLLNLIASGFSRDLMGETEKKDAQYAVRTMVVDKTRKGDQVLQSEINKYVFENEELVTVIKEEEYKFMNVTRIRYRLIMRILPKASGAKESD